MTLKKVYIGGPVNSTHFAKARERNREIAAVLAGAGFEALDPLDFERAEELEHLEGDLDKKAGDLGVATTNQIVDGCLKLLAQADYLLLDLRGMKATGDQTWGTPCEQMFAVFSDMPVIAIVDDFHSAWIEAFCHQVPTLVDAILLLDQEPLPLVDLRTEEPFAVA